MMARTLLQLLATVSSLALCVSARPQATTTSDAPAATASGSEPDDSELTGLCDKAHFVDDGPFCAPKMDHTWYVGGHYYVSWDPTIWKSNATVFLALNYKNFGKAGRVAKNWEVRNSAGFTIVTPEDGWLVNQTVIEFGFSDEKVDNQTMFFTITSDNFDPAKQGDRNAKIGPTVHLTSKPLPPKIDTSKRPEVSFLGLAVGLPVVVGFVLLLVCGTHFCMRNRRQVGPIAIGGGRRHFKKGGYSGRAARRQRAAAGGETEYRDDIDDTEAGRRAEEDRTAREWELANVRGGQQGRL